MTAWRPELGGLLPVYVLDRYEGVEARRFADCTDAEVAAYVEANVAAVRDVVARARPDAALAGHLVMAPLVLARALPADVPYAVKIHGSALEYTVKPEPERFLPAAREGLARARTVLVGSRHTAESLWAAMDDPALPARTRLGPPGVDVEEFRPRPRAEAAADLAALAERLRAARARGRPGRLELRARRRGGRRGARAPGPRSRPPRRVRRQAHRLQGPGPPGGGLAARAGRGARRAAGRRRVRGVAGDVRGARGGPGRAATWAPRGRSRRTGGRARAARPARCATWPRSSTGSPGDARDRYVQAARVLPDRVVLTGRLEHEELAPLLAAAEAQVVPSTYPESFGMVAAEAAAAGALPVSAAHSGLAEVTATLAAAVPPAAAPWLSFPVDDDAVPALAGALVAWLEAGEELRAATRAALVRVARERYSWEGVAEGVVAAAQGRLDVLAPVR